MTLDVLGVLGTDYLTRYGSSWNSAQTVKLKRPGAPSYNVVRKNLAVIRALFAIQMCRNVRPGLSLMNPIAEILGGSGGYLYSRLDEATLRGRYLLHLTPPRDSPFLGS